jgi:hypothetical protein
MTSFVNKYSALDKRLHYLAFNSFPAQITISNLENKIFGKRISGIEIEKPVFVTALPRAGTTLLLELLASTSEFVSSTYRDMPFFMIPVFWSRFSAMFGQSDIPRERAHGDGMMVSADSPEAFEEIIWKTFWRSRYRSDRIIPWNNVNYPEFETFFFNHIRKIIFLKSNVTNNRSRYISKNNLNIARLEYLNNIFPNAIILVLFRDPLQHASSLLRQHLNFLNIHREDTFACKYMKAIGHFDFGKNLRPVDFYNWLTPSLLKQTTTLSFWLRYWINTYRYLHDNPSANTQFISFESIYSAPVKTLKKLGGFLEVRDSRGLVDKANRISIPKLYDIDTAKLKPNDLKEALSLYDSLINKAFI